MAAALVGLPMLGLGALALLRAPSMSDTLEVAVAAAGRRQADRLHTREIVWGDVQDGFAFEFDAQAAELASRLPAIAWDDERAAAYDVRDEERSFLSDAELRSQLAAWAPVFDLVSSAARCRTPGRQTTWWPSLQRGAGQTGVGRIGVEVHLRDQRWRDAAALSCDWVAMLVDHELPDASPPWLAWTDDRVRSIPTHVADELAGALPRLETRMPPIDAGAEIAGWARALLHDSYPASHWTWNDHLAAWAWNFDPVAQHLEAFTLLFAEMERWPAEGTAAEWQARWRSLGMRPDISHSYLVSIALQVAEERLDSRARALTRIRMLRIGLAVRLGEHLPDLLDPFDDGPLRIDDIGDAVFVHARVTGVGSARWTRP